MYKISVTLPDSSSVEYHTAIVPMIGDTLSIDYHYYKVIKRTLFSNNPNFVILQLAD